MMSLVVARTERSGIPERFGRATNLTIYFILRAFTRCARKSLFWRSLAMTLYSARLSASTAFNPPNANEFDSAARTGFSRAVFGT